MTQGQSWTPGQTRVAVLKGGWSPEREVSLVSGAACAEALRADGFDVTDIDAGRDLAAQLGADKPDVVFNALHGRWGEDGCVQGLLEILAIPYTHSGVLASALAMDKEQTKTAFRTVGIPCADGKIVSRAEAANGHVMKPPYVIKPHNQGSSVGVFIIREGDNRPPEALTHADWTLGDAVMVEQFIPGRELTVAVLGGKPLGVTEIVTDATFYDYDAKYAAGGSRHILPAPVPDEVAALAQAYAVKAHEVIGCRGVTRTDFRYDDTKDTPGRLVALEINTQPGMTPTSLVPEQANHADMSFGSLVRWILEDASCPR